ncbi:hypothetical protein CB1_001241010 [Camelus ferus]|nr:hypothetical protein CB1_001241010 [Camelus ferus]
MIGCSFVVNRKFFGEIGLLDPGMDVYGGENIELGIKNRQRRRNPLLRLAKMDSPHSRRRLLGSDLDLVKVWVPGSVRPQVMAVTVLVAAPSLQEGRRLFSGQLGARLISKHLYERIGRRGSTPLPVGFGTYHPASVLSRVDPLALPETPDIKIPDVQKPLVTFVFRLEFFGSSPLRLSNIGACCSPHEKHVLYPYCCRIDICPREKWMTVSSEDSLIQDQCDWQESSGTGVVASDAEEHRPGREACSAPSSQALYDFPSPASTGQPHQVTEVVSPRCFFSSLCSRSLNERDHEKRHELH